MKAFVVPCVSQKVWDLKASPTSVAAKDAYVEGRFRKWRRYAEGSDLPWFILSTKYGLVRPEQNIENYNRGITDAVADRALRASLARQGVELGLAQFTELELLDYEKFQPLLEAAVPGVPITIKRITTPGSARW
jgi:hypothetical protein